MGKNQRRNRGIDITKEVFANQEPRRPPNAISSEDALNGRYNNRRGRYNNRRGGYNNRRGGYNDRRGGGGYNDRRGGGGYNDRRGGGGYNDRRGGDRRRDDGAGWERGSEFEKYSKEVEDKEQGNGPLEFFNRGLYRDEKLLRNYLYEYLQYYLETRIKEDEESGNFSNKLTFNLKEQQIVEDVFGDDNRVNVYRMLKKTNDRGFNPICSSVYRAMVGMEPGKDRGDPKLYNGNMMIKNITIAESQFSEYVWCIHVLLREWREPRRNKRRNDSSRSPERQREETPREESQREETPQEDQQVVENDTWRSRD